MTHTVSAQATLGGYTALSFNAATNQASFKEAVATTYNVLSSVVVITFFSDSTVGLRRRRTEGSKNRMKFFTEGVGRCRL